MNWCKKIMLLLITMLLVITLSGCSDEGKKSNNDSKNSVPVPNIVLTQKESKKTFYDTLWRTPPGPKFVAYRISDDRKVEYGSEINRAYITDKVVYPRQKITYVYFDQKLMEVRIHLPLSESNLVRIDLAEAYGSPKYYIDGENRNPYWYVNDKTMVMIDREGSVCFGSIDILNKRLGEGALEKIFPK